MVLGALYPTAQLMNGHQALCYQYSQAALQNHYQNINTICSKAPQIMALYEIYSHPLRQSYRAPINSLAFALQFISLLVTIVVPLLVAYWSQGFWVKTGTYYEQPEVHFKYQFILFIQGDREGTNQVWSTFALLNSLAGDSLVPATVSSHMWDRNMDGLGDQLDITVNWPLLPQITAVTAVRAAFVLDYSLQLQSRLRMESLAVIEANAPHFSNGASKLTATGNLVMKQVSPLQPYGIDIRYESPIVDQNKLKSGLNWHELMQAYDTRNISTVMQNVRFHWHHMQDTQSTTSREFELKFSLRIDQQQFTYYTGFWQLVKWAWIQYLSIVVILVLIFSRIREGAFRGRFVRAIPNPVQFYSFAYGSRDRG